MSKTTSLWEMAKHLGKIRSRLRNGQRTWWIDLRPHGRIWSFKGRPIQTRALAQEVLDSVRAEYRNKKPLDVALAEWAPKVAAQNTVGPLYARWLERLQGQVEAGTLSASYVRELRRYGQPDGYLEPLREIAVKALSYADLEDLTDSMTQRGLSAKSQKHVLAALRTFLRWVKRRDAELVVPEFPVLSVPEYQPTIVAPETQRAVLEAIAEERRGIFLALAYHGLRPSEACRLDVADWDRKAGLLKPQAAKMKTRTGRQIPVSPELQGWLKLHTRDRIAGPLFQNPQAKAIDRRWTLWTLWNAWGSAARSVGVEVGLYEGTKHSSATAARRAGVPLEIIQQALGHSSSKSTALYARAAEVAPVAVLQGRRVVARLSPAKKRPRK